MEFSQVASCAIGAFLLIAASQWVGDAVWGENLQYRRRIDRRNRAKLSR